MAGGLTGWYPDPGGARGRYRYWNGTSWSVETTDDPRQLPPADPGGAGGRRPRRWGLIIGVLAVVVVIVVALSVVTSRGLPTAEPPLPTSTVVGGDDSADPRPPPRPQPPRSASPSPSSAYAVPAGALPRRATRTSGCPIPVDDRVYGGNLSFARGTQLSRPPTPKPRISFGYDVAQQALTVE